MAASSPYFSILTKFNTADASKIQFIIHTKYTPTKVEHPQQTSFCRPLMYLKQSFSKHILFNLILFINHFNCFKLSHHSGSLSQTHALSQDTRRNPCKASSTRRSAHRSTKSTQTLAQSRSQAYRSLPKLRAL